MGYWSKYESLGLWGLWCEHFGPEAFFVSLAFEGQRWSLSGIAGEPVVDAPDQKQVAFNWVSPGGLEVVLYSEVVVSPEVADLWNALLYFEAAAGSRAQTFFPSVFPVSPFAQEVAQLLARAPELVFFNGQPGTGKRTLLGCLALLHARRCLSTGSVVLLSLPGVKRPAVVVPEVALLEIDEQKALSKSIERGDHCWVASVYDVTMLKNRKILHGALAESLEVAKIVLPAVARRDPKEIEALTRFWGALHGKQAAATPANLGFLKQKALGQAGLSVEAILEEGRGLRGVIGEFEKEAILKAQARVGRSQHKIARLLKVSRGSLQHKLRKYQLESFASPDADTEEG